MQVTVINNVNAQIISGPDNVPSGTYTVPGINPYVRYHWGQVIEGASSYTLQPNPVVAPGAENESVAVTWDLNQTIHHIKVVEEPIFDPFTIDVPATLNNDIAQIPEDIIIQAAIETVKNNVASGGMGTVRLLAGTHWINEIHLAEGVRIIGVGSGPGGTVLKRTDVKANEVPITPPYQSFNKMLTTYWTGVPEYYQYFTFLPINNFNSKPIEICSLRINGNKTIPVAAASPDQFEQTALIYLKVPHHIDGPLYVNGSWMPEYNNTTSPAKLKVFIHDINFENSGGDAVLLDENVDLNMYDCDGFDIYRGTYTLGGCGTISRMINVNTHTTDPNTILTKSIDFECDQPGYQNDETFRAWYHNCDFDKNAQFNFANSHVLLTDVNVLAPPTYFEGIQGDLVVNNCALSFYPVVGETPNYILAPKHAKFNNTIFDFKAPQLGFPVNGCFNGLYYKNHTTYTQLGITYDVYYDDAHIGFNSCTFVDNINMPLWSKYGIYLFNNNNNNIIPISSQNNSDKVQLFFKDNIVANTFTSPDLPILYNSSCPTIFSTDFAPGVINNNEIYTGGESEEQMKHHFGIRPIYILKLDAILINVTCNNVANGSISALAVGGAGVINYSLQPLNLTNQTGFFSNLSPNTYTITATDVLNNTVSTVITITQPTPIVLTASATDATCNGANGQLTFSASGGTGIIGFEVNGSPQVSPYATIANTYTIVATDANNCTVITTIVINEPTLILLTASATNATCNGANGQLIFSATGGTGIINFEVNGTPQASPFVTLAGTYTIVATDVNNCIVSTTISITQPSPLVVVASNISNVTCSGGNNGTAQANGYGGVAPYSFSISAPGVINANNGAITGLNAGTYTVTNTDANLCIVTTTFIITQPAALIWSNISFNNITCNDPGADNGSINVTATGGTGAISYHFQWPDPNAGSITQATGQFGPIVPHNYTITASDANGCTITTTIDLLNPSLPAYNFCCSPFAASVVATPNVLLKVSPTSSQLLAACGGVGSTISGKYFYIDNALTIDANIIFDNCILWFTPTGSVQFAGQTTLTLQGGSELKASCDWWEGIEGTNAFNKVTMTGGSMLKNAQYGIRLSNNAVIEVDNAHFIDNGLYAIRLSNMTLLNYPGYIKNSTFTTQQNLPGGLWNRTNTGIYLNDVRDLNIGELNNVVNSGSSNTFDGMYTGILVGNSSTVTNSKIGIYNNSFSNIQSGSNDEYGKMVNCYTDAKGAAVYCKADANPLQICHVDVQNDNVYNVLNPTFLNCDKAIVSLGNKLDAKFLNTDNCLLGIMCQSVYNRDYYISNNIIVNTHIGIQLSGGQRSAVISNNEVLAHKTVNEMNGNQVVSTYAPIGISVLLNPSLQLAVNNHLIVDNTIWINRIAGVGIFNASVGKNFEERGNFVHFTTNSTAPTTNYNITTLMGYYNVNNYKSKYLQNTTIGPGGNAQVWQARTSISMLMNESRMCKLDCNRLRFTRFGFFVWGNNTTTETNITHNKCNANAIPWFFLDNANKGTFGNVGNATDPDNGNEFISTANPIDWRNSIPAINSNYKVFRLSGGIFPEKIFTSNSLLDFSESGPLFSGWEYLYQPSFQILDDPCAEDNEYEPEYFAEPDVDSNEYNSAMAVAQDSMAYINFPTVGSWIDQYKLYMELDTDSLLLNSSPELLYFYNTTSTQTIGDIKYAAEKIALLYDSTTNASNDSLRFVEAVVANTLISSANDWEMNEKTVNDVLLFMYNNSIDSIPLNMMEDMQFLASSCPFVEGTAVYRARTIYSLWEPNAIFDDRIICIQGQNKNQDNSRLNIDSLIESQIADANIEGAANYNYAYSSAINAPKRLHKNQVDVYPNPASSVIIISYESKEDGYFKLYNSFGEIIVSTTLAKDVRKTQLQIENVANGIYHFEVKFPNMLKTIGKLTILK